MVSDIKRWSQTPNQSLILALVLMNACVIKIVYKSGGVYFTQFLLINLCLYVSFKGYEKYINYIDGNRKEKYKIVRKKFFLEVFFFLLTIFSVAVAIYFDIQNLVFVDTFRIPQ